MGPGGRPRTPWEANTSTFPGRVSWEGGHCFFPFQAVGGGGSGSGARVRVWSLRGDRCQERRAEVRKLGQLRRGGGGESEDGGGGDIIQ